MKLEELKRGMLVEGVTPDGAVTLKDVESVGNGTVEVIFKNASGDLGNRLLSRSDEPNLKVVREDGGWRFDGNGARFRLAVEARRIGSAYLFDPLLAVHTSLVDSYPHQISAVYERMLNRQPLRFLLADDPGAEKTIMAGLLIKELMARGDLERAAARRLQSHFVASFFLEAVRLFGGKPTEPEKGRFKLGKVPDVIFERARRLPGGGSISNVYERVTFEKSLRSVEGRTPATFFYPGHPVVDAAGQLVLERCGENLARGAALVDESDPGTEPRVLALLEHTIRDGRKGKDGENRLAGRRMQFVEVSADGTTRNAGFAPHLDYRPIREEEKRALRDIGDLPKDAAEKARSEPPRRIASDGALVTRWAPINLKSELDKYLWRGGEHVSLTLIREDPAKYLYLPRLRDEKVLEERPCGTV